MAGPLISSSLIPAMDNEDVEIRAARPEEADAVLHVLCAAFRLPYEAARPIFYSDPFFDLSHKRVLWTRTHGIVSCLTILPTRLRVGGTWLSLGGIAGVATHPAHQGRGYAGQLLAATMPTLAGELGYPLSGLFAHSENLYRRFGWETASQARCHVLSTSMLTALTAPGIVRSAGSEDDPGWAAVRAIHASTAADAVGRCLRDDRRWHLVAAAPGREWSVYQTAGQSLCGYAAWERRGRCLHVLEMRAAMPEAAHGLLAYLARQLSPEEHLEWVAAPDEIAALNLTEACVDTTPEPGLMLRLANLSAALAAVHPIQLAPVLAQTGRTLTLRACDPLRPENSDPVRLTMAGVTPGQDSDPDWIQGDIAALAPVFLGFRTPADAAAQGLLQASSSSALALAEQLFPARTPFVPPLDQF